MPVLMPAMVPTMPGHRRVLAGYYTSEGRHEVGQTSEVMKGKEDCDGIDGS